MFGPATELPVLLAPAFLAIIVTNMEHKCKVHFSEELACSKNNACVLLFIAFNHLCLQDYSVFCSLRKIWKHSGSNHDVKLWLEPMKIFLVRPVWYFNIEKNVWCAPCVDVVAFGIDLQG